MQMELEGHMRLALHDDGSAAHHSEEGLYHRGDSHAPHSKGGVDLLLHKGQLEFNVAMYQLLLISNSLKDTVTLI